MKKIYTYFTVMLLAVIGLSSCESNDQYEADLLVSGDWQGYLGAYYNDRWGLSGTTYETVMHFSSAGSGATSGRGYEADYDTRSPYADYAYCEFSWSIVDGVITLIYDDSQWTPVYISDYWLSSSRFSGYINDGTRRDIRFELENVRFGNWDTYRNYYDDYYYGYRTRSANGKSVAAGAFAKGME